MNTGAIDLHIESGDPSVRSNKCATSVLLAAGTDPYLLLQVYIYTERERERALKRALIEPYTSVLLAAGTDPYLLLQVESLKESLNRALIEP